MGVLGLLVDCCDEDGGEGEDGVEPVSCDAGLELELELHPNHEL